MKLVKVIGYWTLINNSRDCTEKKAPLGNIAPSCLYSQDLGLHLTFSWVWKRLQQHVLCRVREADERRIAIMRENSARFRPSQPSLKEHYYSASLCRRAHISFVEFQAASLAAKRHPYFQQVLWASGLSSCQAGYSDYRILWLPRDTAKK